MSFEEELKKKIKSEVKIDEPMSLHTSWQVGGPVDYYVCPGNIKEIKAIVRVCNKYDMPTYVIGNGSNLLVLDGGIRGLVINIGPPFSYVNRVDRGLVAGAGTPMTMLAKTAVEYGLTGLEFTAGIPGSLGGAVNMNAGAFGGYIGEHLRSVTLITPEGEVKKMSSEEIVFGYRTSSLVGKGIVVEVELELCEGDLEQSRSKIEHFLSERRRRHPDLPSCGSVFRNL